MRDTARRCGKEILTFGFHFRHAETIAFLKKVEAGEMGTLYAGDVTWLRRQGIPAGAVLRIWRYRVADR